METQNPTKRRRQEVLQVDQPQQKHHTPMVVMPPLSQRPSNSKMIIFFRPDSFSKTTPSRNLAKRILSYRPQ